MPPFVFITNSIKRPIIIYLLSFQFKLSNLAPPTKLFPQISTSKPEETKITPPKDKPAKKRSNKLKIAGKSFKVGDYAYVTERKCIARIDTIEFPTNDIQPLFLDVTW